MELEPGYKQTEAGVIPEDWDVDEIIRCADYVDYRGKTPTKASSGILLLTARNIRAGFIDYEVSREYILSSEYESAMQRGRPRVGDVVITTEAPLGMVASLDRDDVALAQRVIKYRGKSGRLRSAFLKFYFLSPRFQSLLNENSSGSTAKGIKGSVLHRLPVILPPLSEQDSIAGALNDADALVNSLEQLIAKKRDLRQGAIQELFRPNTAWVEESLGHVAEIRDGTHQTPKYVEDGVPFFSVENVTSGDFTNTKFISEAEHNLLTRSFKIEKGDILMTRIGSIGDCKLIDWNVDASFYVSLALLKIRKGYSAAFICYYSETALFKKEVELNSLQSAIPKKINLGQISNVRMKLPASLDEQSSIASVLSDVDAEIAALETKLAKARQLKQGMMQELLTGRTRLI